MEDKKDCLICSLIENYSKYSDTACAGSSCQICDAPEKAKDMFLLDILFKIEGLTQKNAIDMVNLSDDKLKEDLIKMVLLIDNKTNAMTVNGERIEWTFANNTYGKFNSKIKDCNDQTSATTDYLKSYQHEFNYDWDFNEVVNPGHVYGVVKLKSPDYDKVFLTYDPRARSFALNKRCSSCKGWFGSNGNVGTANGDIGFDDYVNSKDKN